MLRCWLLRQLQCKWDSNMWYCVSRYHSSLMTSFLEDINPSWLNFQIAYVALLVAEAVTVQMRQQYVILCFKIPFLLEDIIPSWLNFQIAYVALLIKQFSNTWFVFQDTIPPWWWRHHSFLIKLSDCICCAVGCWGSYSANETAICDIVFQDTIPPWWHHSFLIKLSDCICCAVGCWGSYSANETAICDIVFQDTIPPWWHSFLIKLSLHMLRCWLLRQLQCKWDRLNFQIAYVALLVAEAVTVQMRQQYVILMFQDTFLEDIIPSWLNFQIAYVALLVAEAVTVQMRQQYVILCFKIPFLLDDIIPWRHHSFLIKLSDCICCAVGCWLQCKCSNMWYCVSYHSSLKTFLLD